MPSQQKSHARLVALLIAATFGMLLFAFAMVPLYDAFCEMTGINNKGGRVRVEIPTEVDTSRIVKIQFITHIHGDLPWEFYAEQKTLEVHPGEVNRVSFIAENDTANERVAQFVATVSPAVGDRYVKRTECFSFNRQFVDGLTQKEMSMVFFIDKDIPPEIEEIILFYTLFDNTEGADT